MNYVAKLSVVFSLICLCAGFNACKAQKEYTSSNKKAIKLYEDGKELFIKRDFAGAKEKLSKATELDPEFAEPYIYLGEVAFSENILDKAESYYNKGIAIDSVKFGKLFNVLASVYTLQMKYRDAVSAYQSYITNYEKLKPDNKTLVEKEIERLQALIPIIENPVPFDPINLGPKINTAEDEYHPAIASDGSMLLFTAIVKANANTCATGRGREEEFFVSYRENDQWSERKNLGYPVNSNCNEGAGGLSPDGKKLFFAATDRDPSNLSPSMDLYLSENIGGKWQQPVNLGPPVNTHEYETQPSFSSDGKTLYFSSKRKGGYGGTDIYISLLNEDGTWTEPVNLGPNINTSGDEISPFIHPDGVTLYFASSGHLSLGGTDFFIARRNALGEFESPKNLGYPINTTGNERSLIISADGKTGYYASDKPGGYGGFDLYQFELYEGARPDIVTYLKGKTYNINSKENISAKFELTDLKENKIIASSVSDKITGEFLLNIPVDRDYALTVSADHYLNYSETFRYTGIYSNTDPYFLDIPMTPISIGGKVELKNIFFDTDKYDLKPESSIELDKWVTLMKNNPAVKIEIEGHTDNQGTKQHNQVLSENRAKSVLDYLVSKGISKSRFTYKGYGDTQPKYDNNTEGGRAQNRRTEFKVTGL